MLVWLLHLVVFVCVWPCVYGDCGCLRGRMHVCWCVRLYGDCVVFVCVSCHVCMVIVGVRVNVCMCVNVCACMVIVLCLYVSLAMFVL